MRLTGGGVGYFRGPDLEELQPGHAAPEPVENSFAQGNRQSARKPYIHHLPLLPVQTFLSLNVQETADAGAETHPGFQRTFSACPVALSASRLGDSERLEDAITPGVAAGRSDPAWPLQGQWAQAARLPRTSLQCIPFRADRSVSVIEGSRSEAKGGSSRYKTELCRTFEESGACKYGTKCQFAHGAGELRGLSRHPKYKTEPCRTFHTCGICPYGSRCHFIHNAEERRPLPQPPLLLCHSLSSGEPLPPASPASPAPAASRTLRLPHGAVGCSLCNPLGSSKAPLGSPGPSPFPGLLLLQKSHSADSLSDQEDSGSSGASSGSASPGLGPLGRRLPIFSSLSVSDD
ncbi:mRNA decay activator protein ZFP36L1-like [Eublepharis macularius]|uniref:mRNA decay activator protein ZFP36 n=1 Tax=Eublepharis macularius TaxID=481883 RepID=A0AA97KF31_EUBMA|nr:mRNA decay activator protein ZFP36L1-like [Eublepharis macularius]